MKSHRLSSVLVLCVAVIILDASAVAAQTAARPRTADATNRD
jgi:hypothetical protein